ncbi:uncharacterized protein [Choristoneura fumiferana]|uniref:uncharacterized protein n=1 Tax=Choristoneura fumiferana TaxID=7141 RepID=UPI003D157B83
MMKLVVLSCLLAAASAGLLAPFAPFAPLAYSSAYIAPYYNSNYRGPLSLAPGQPANILAADGRPLDTLDVNLDRSAHLTAKALEGGVHLLKKRSAPILAAPIAPVVAPLAYSSAYIAPYYNSNYRGPLSLAPGQPANILAADGRPLDTLDVNLDRSAHLTAKALEGGVHLLKKRSAPILTAPIAPVTRVGYAGAPLIAHASPIAYSAPITTAYAAPYAPLAYPYAGHIARYW